MILILVFLLTSCNNNSNKELKLTVEYKSDLESCTLELEGMTSYVESENKFYYCNNPDWIAYK